MPTILLCDDDPSVHDSLSIYLEAEGFEYVSVYDGESAIQKAVSQTFDVILLDIMMPKKSGIEVCKYIRSTVKTPIIMLTAKGEEIDIILGLELGADDYMVKPFNPREVLARIKVILRRIQEAKEHPSAAILHYKGLEVNLAQYKLSLDGKVISAAPKEIEILHLLMSNPGLVFSRDQILQKIWGNDYYGDTRTIDTHINRIRTRLTEELSECLQTIYGVGYKFEGVEYE